MDNNMQVPPSELKKNPTELLNSQTQSLWALVEIQKAQSAQIEELRKQNEKMINLFSNQQAGNSTASLGRVKIENVNMPFSDMIGFMLKVALASIPAGIILGILYVIVVAVFGGILSALF